MDTTKEKDKINFPEVKPNPIKLSHPCHHDEDCCCGYRKGGAAMDDKTIGIFEDSSDNFHPYECEPSKCIHCNAVKTENHDPNNCALCNEGQG